MVMQMQQTLFNGVILVENNVKATWFVTHNSNHVKELAKIDLFELGIHPNFSHDSTQGKNVGDILSNLKKIMIVKKLIKSKKSSSKERIVA